MKKEKTLILRSTLLILAVYISILIGCRYTDIGNNPFFPVPIIFGVGVWLYFEGEEFKKLGVVWGLIGFFGTWGYIELVLYLLGKSPIF